MSRLKFVLAGVLFSLLPFNSATAGSPEMSMPVDPKGEIPFAFAISGGISLGSYEAGLN